MNCMNQSRGLQDVAASTSNNTSIHSLIQLHEAGRDTTQTANSSSRAPCSNYIEQLSIMSKAHGHEKYDVEGNCVLVAVNAAKMSRHALEWALTNIVQPGDHITLLALLPAGGRRLWSLAVISGDCARRTVVRRGAKLTGKPQDVEEEISDCCSCMMQELRSLCDSKKAKVSIKVVAEGKRGAVAMEADRIGASWVVLDKHVMKKEGKICLEQLKCNVVMVKQSKSSKILRLNLKGSAASTAHDDPKLARTLTNTENRSLIKDDAGVIKENRECGNQVGSLKRAAAISSRSRAARLNSAASKRRAKHRATINAENVFKFYEGAATSESSDAEDAAAHAHACAHLFSSESETDSTVAKDLRYIGALCTKLHLDSDQEVSHKSGYSDLDMLSSSSEMNGHRLCEHSGLLCTPATSSPSNELQPSGFDPNVPISGQQLFAQGMGEMGDLFREAWKPAPCIITCGSSMSMSMSKPNSASTTPKSDTLTLTGSSYPKPSRSPSPSNQHAPPVTSSNQHAPPLPCSARVSRSPSPSKSNSCTPPNTNNAGGVKLSSSAACTNVFYSATTTSTAACTPRPRPHLIPDPGSSQPVPAMSGSCTSKNTASRRQDFIRISRQIADQLAEHGNGFCSTSSTVTSSSAASRRISDREVTTRELMQRFSEWDHQGSSKQKSSSSAASSSYSYRKDHAMEMELNDLERTSSVRRAMTMLGSGGVVRHPAPAGPPPLCSICQHKAPVFGKPPRRFSYAELELATGGFSKVNFLAEGGFGSVHRGVLPDGQAVAVKQHKLASSQGDNEFCSEVEVLSCAQHRNVVMLIGYCIEHCRRLLVYEFICNGSLDSHLYSGSDQDVLSWAARQKVAVGAARGLRYLHEECRVGCIIHRDMRPNNILLTHDYEPMVGDFGLARWQPDGDLGVQTRVIGTFGYLAPEYAQSGEVTEKADVYSFGVVLLELVTGRKAVDLARPKGQQCLTEWARPLLEEGANMRQLLDPRLPEDEYDEYELFCALHAASLCIRRDHDLRPRMSQVLRILEGDVVIDTSGTSTISPSYFTEAKLAAGDHDQAAGSSYNGSRSSRIPGEYNQRGVVGGESVSPPLVSYSGSLLSSAGRKRLPPHQLQYSCGLAKLSSYPPPHLSNPYSKRLSFEES